MSEEEGAEPYRVAKLGRHSIIYGIGLLLTKAVSIVMLPIYTRWLTPADYGVLQLIAMTFEVVTIFAGSRIAWGIFHFYHKEEDEPGRRRVLSTALLLLATMYGIAGAGTIVAAPAIAELVFGGGGQFTIFVRIAAAAMAFEGLALVPNALFQLENRSKVYVGVSLIKLGMQVVLNLIFLIPFEMGVAGVLLSSLIANAVIGIALAVYLLVKVGARFGGDAAKGFLRFGIPLVAMQIATFVLTFGDRYFLNRATDTTEVGLYGLAYQFGFLVATVGFGPFQQVWDPQRFDIAKRPDRDEIFAKVFVYLNLVLLSAAVGVALFGGDVLRIIATKPFYPAAAYIPVLAAAYVFQCWGTFLNLGIFLKEKTEYFTYANWIAAGVALAGYIYLIPIWYAWGAVISTFAALLVRCWLAHLFSQRLWRIEYRWAPVARLGALAVLVGTLSELSPSLSLPTSIGFHVALFGLYATLAWILPVLSKEEKATVKRQVNFRMKLVRDLVLGEP